MLVQPLQVIIKLKELANLYLIANIDIIKEEIFLMENNNINNNDVSEL
jgi:hypothetical protein